jgi:hypothetical protein
VTRQGDGTRPQFGPVGEAFVTIEVHFVDQGLRRSGVRDAVGLVSDTDFRLGQFGAAAQVCPEPVEGSARQGVRYWLMDAVASRAERASCSASASWAML